MADPFFPEWFNKNNLKVLWATVKLNMVHAAAYSKGTMLYWGADSTIASPIQPSKLTLPETNQSKRVLGIVSGLPAWRELSASVALSGTAAVPTLTLSVYGQNTTAAIPIASHDKSGLISIGNQEFAGIKTFRNNVVIGSPDAPAHKASLLFYNSTGLIRHVLGISAAAGNNDLIIGYDTVFDGAKTRIFGTSIEFMRGASRTVGMVLGESGTLSVVGNIESTNGGVAANGIADLAVSGAGGASGTVTKIQVGSGSIHEPDVNGLVRLDAYPDLAGYATKDWATGVFASKTALTAVTVLIPSAATASNQLADKAFVNSSIATNTATFRGTSAAGLTEAQFLTWANSLTHDLNDYVFWQTADGGNTVFKRYKYNGSNWMYEYSLNNSSFTADQWAAINSGATATSISNILSKTIGTAKGDLIYFTAASAPSRLGIGSAGQFLGIASGVPAWQNFATPSLAWTDGTTSGPSLKVTVQGKTSASYVMPSADLDKSGIVTTDVQTLAGHKTFAHGLTLGQLQALKVTNASSSVTYDAVKMVADNVLLFGHATAAAGFTTWLCGNEIRFRYGANNSFGFILTTDGNIGMGISSPSSKLHVIGTTTLQAVIPHSTNSYDIGSSSRYWRDIYLNNLKAATTLSMYIGGNQKAALTATGLAVFGGVSANGIDSLAVSGAGGASGTVTKIQVGTGSIYEPDVNGLVQLDAYPDLTDYATKGWVTGAFAAKATIAGLSQSNWTIAGNNYGVFTRSAMPQLYEKNLQLNGNVQKFLSADNATAVAIYAPITAGTAGQLACSSGAGAPSWMNQSDVVAGNLAGTILSQDTEFSSRPSADTTDIDTGTATLQVIKGNSVVWNQLVANPNFSSTAGWSVSGATFSVANNICTFTSSQTNGFIRSNDLYTATTNQRTNVLYLSAWVKLTSPTTDVSLRIANGGQSPTTSATTEWQHISYITTHSTTYSPYVRIQDNRTSGWDAIQIRNIIVINLTQMFGFGNEPQSVAEFEKLYNPITSGQDVGSMLSLSATDIKTTGFNVWDEQWENASLSYVTGEAVPSTAHVCSKNFIPVFPNTTYYRKNPYTDAEGQLNRVAFYDANKKYLGNIGWMSFSGNGLFTTPAGAYYMRFYVSATFYNNNICINISHSGTKNGIYEPYAESRLPLGISSIRGKLNGTGTSVVVFPDGLRSAGQVFDEIRGNRVIKRIGKAMMGDKHISPSYPDEGIFAVKLDLDIANATQNVISTHYVESYAANLAVFRTDAKSGMLYVNNNDTIRYIYLKNDAFIGKTAAEVKALLTEWGAIAYFELTTPEEYTLDSEVGGEYYVNDWGTETANPLMEPLSTSLPTPLTTPLRADIKYGLNAADTVKNVPATYQPVRNRVDSIEGAYSQLYPSVKAVWDFAGIMHGKSGSQPSDPVDTHVIQVGANRLFLKFNAAVDGVFELEVADAIEGNRQSFTFGTISAEDINSICTL